MKTPNAKKNSDLLKEIFKKITSDEAKLLLQIICQDPFIGFCKKVLIYYVIFLFLILLWPFNFSFFEKKNHVTWSDTPPGIDFIGEGQVISRAFSRPFYESLVEGKGFSLEVWISPANIQQDGPARIVSYSLNLIHRNFTLGQQGTDLIMRLRTENTSLNGMEPELTVQDVFSRESPLHIVISYNYEEQSVFINGRLRTTSIIPGGDFKNWDFKYPLIFGNEATGDRPWLGKISYVAIYNYPLDARGVQSSYNEVRSWISGNLDMAAPGKGLVVRYLFDEKKGTNLKDTGTLAESLTLNIPEKIQTKGKPFLGFSLRRLPTWGSGPFYEIVLNVLLFIPFGFLLHPIIASHMDGNWIPMLIVLAVGGTATLSAETLQYFSETRNSSLVDVIANAIGVFLGAQLSGMYITYLLRNKKIICEFSEKQVKSCLN